MLRCACSVRCFYFIAVFFYYVSGVPPLVPADNVLLAANIIEYRGAPYLCTVLSFLNRDRQGKLFPPPRFLRDISRSYKRRLQTFFFCAISPEVTNGSRPNFHYSPDDQFKLSWIRGESATFDRLALNDVRVTSCFPGLCQNKIFATNAVMRTVVKIEPIAFQQRLIMNVFMELISLFFGIFFCKW